MSGTSVHRSDAAAARSRGARGRRRRRGYGGPSIFLCYRREDTAGHTGRLYDRLSEHFGRGRVFVDIDTIEPGEDFVDVIDAAIGGSDVFLVLIGDEWVVDAAGRRRLDDPNDFVRLELAAALAKDARVIPILVEDADMPSPEDLPAELRPVTRRNALPLSNTRWQYDTDRLIATIEHVLHHEGGLPEPAEISPAPAAEPRGRAFRATIATAVFVLIAAAAVAGVLLLGDGSGDGPVPAPSGATAVSVPGIVGRRQAVAVERLESLEIQYVIERGPSAERPEGVVYDQEPDAGTRITRETDVVTLFVSTGAPTTTVPDVRGRSRDDAVVALADAGLRPNVVEVSSSEPENTVIAQDPKPGDAVEEGTSVRINVSAGPAPVVVPSVVGQSYDAALAQLQDAGFQVARRDIDSEAPAGTVVEQSPAGGATASHGTLVTLTVSQGPSTVPVPDVTSLDRETAVARLEAEGFRANVVAHETDDRSLVGHVVSQDPEGGAQRAPGSPVTIRVGRLALVVIPTFRE